MLQEYAYRKEFGLSAQEFAEEPWDVYLINSHIMNTIGEMNRREMKKASKTRPHIPRRK